MNTVDDFAAGLRLRYERLKDANAHYLHEPTPAKLRDLCHDIASHELPEDDRQALAAFFGRTQSLLTAIENTKAVKMKNVLFFLQGRNQNTNRETLNLLAVMLDFKNRPLRKFLKEGPDVLHNEEIAEPGEKKEMVTTGKNEAVKDISVPPVRRKVKFNLKKEFLVYALLLSLLPGTIASLHYFNTPGCMIWAGNHYENTDCDIAGSEAYDESQFSLQEIEVKKGDVFFEDDKPIVWYCRRDGYHFFNKRGFDPVSGKPLMPITRQVLIAKDLWE